MCSPEVMRIVREEVNRRQLLKGAGSFGVAAVGATLISRGVASAQDGTPVPVGSPPAAPVATPAPPVELPAGLGRVVDLTHVASPDFPLYPGTFPFTIENVANVANDGYYSNNLSLSEHTATHMDAPAHFIADGATAELIDPQTLVAPLCIVHIHERAATDPDAQVTVDDILAWESANGPLPTGAFVAMHSGWEARLGDPATYINLDDAGVQHYPGFHPEAATFLVTEREISGIGVDTLSQDYGASADFATHIAILGAGKYGIENVANLATVPDAGAWVVVGGPKHATASGGPTRILALVQAG